MIDGTWAKDSRKWHVSDDGATYTVARRLPVRWDVAAQTIMPDLGRRRLAHAIRQDMWRMLQDVRGFAPVVEVTRTDAGCAVRAGGQVAGRVASSMRWRIAEMLGDPAYRAAWMRAAAHRRVA